MTDNDNLQPVFHSDQAIRKSSEDALNRRSFAVHLANAVRSIPGDESMVISLYGPWGSGKSSVKNLMVEALESDQESSPIILEFNPWRLGDENQLLVTFFSEVSKKLADCSSGKTPQEGASKRVELWQRYGRYVAFGGSATKAASTIMSIVGVPGSPLVDLLGKALSSSGEMIKHGEGAAEAQAEEENLTLEELRNALRASFEAEDFKKNLLVLIDDIDRLTLPEIAQIIRLVKANSDFPRFIFVLLCEEDRVARALDSGIEGEGGGKEYLEKIVQVPFNIPKASQHDLDQYFLDKFNRMLKRVGKGAQGVWDSNRDDERFGSLFQEFLRPNCKNLRTLNRLFNALGLAMSSFVSKGHFEANPVDVLALEAMRAFEPHAYKELLDCTPQTLLNQDLNLWTDNKKRIEEVVSQIRGAAREPAHVVSVLRILFPPLHGALGGGGGFGESARGEWRSHLRVCSEECFDRYFEFDIRPTDLRESEVGDVLASISDADALSGKIDQLAEQERLGLLLTRLEESEELINLKTGEAVALFVSLWDKATSISDQENWFVSYDGRSQVTALMARYLKLVVDVAERGKFVSELVNTTKSPSSAAYIVARFEADQRSTSGGTPLLDKESTEKASGKVLERLQIAESDGVLSDVVGEWPGIIQWWADHAPSDAKVYVADSLSLPSGMFAFLRSCSGSVSSGLRSCSGSVSSGKEVYKYVDLSAIEEVMRVEEVAEAATRITTAGIADDELQEYIDRFFYAMDRRKAGLSTRGMDMSLDSHREKVLGNATPKEPDIESSSD